MNSATSFTVIYKYPAVKEMVLNLSYPIRTNPTKYFVSSYKGDLTVRNVPG